MQKKEREIERNAGTGAIRVEFNIASESMEVSEAEREEDFQKFYKDTISQISLDAETFTHPEPAYQVLAAQGNMKAGRLLNLVQTESMLRAKDAITKLPPVDEVDSDFGEYSESDSDATGSPIDTRTSE